MFLDWVQCYVIILFILILWTQLKASSESKDVVRAMGGTVVALLPMVGRIFGWW